MSTNVEFKLHKDWQRHTGHCQITYTTKNDSGQSIVYCLQDNGKNHGGIRLMRCSQDGEPSHEAMPKQGAVLRFEVPLGNSELEILAKEWIVSRGFCA